MASNHNSADVINRNRNAIHTFIHNNPRCKRKDITAVCGIGLYALRMRLNELMEARLIKSEGKSGQGGRGLRYTSIVEPVEFVEFSATKKQPTPPSLILSKLWTPDHLKLSA